MPAFCASNVIEETCFWVVKIGSAQLTDTKNAGLRQSHMAHIAQEIRYWRNRGKKIILVSSGAVSAGRGMMGWQKRKLKLEEKQACAAIGQPALMQAWSNVLGDRQIKVAQALLMLDDTENRQRWLNARATLEVLLANDIVPIINENDTTATDELRYGDNDRLAARIAQMLAADLLILLSDVDGFYAQDPAKNPTASKMSYIERIEPAMLANAGDANHGTGGMRSKLEAVQIAMDSGLRSVISLGTAHQPLSRLATEQTAGSWFVPPGNQQKSRRNWLLGLRCIHGKISVDMGAVEALRLGASLLPVGVRACEGAFKKGELVAMFDPQGHKCGQGIAAHDAAHCRQLIEAAENEKAKGKKAKHQAYLIHRDDLVMFAPLLADEQQK